MKQIRQRRGAAALGITLSALLSACGGGGGSAAVGGATGNSMTLNATPALGAFVDGATVIVFDASGKECSRAKTATGSAALTINTTTCVAPLVVQAGVVGDQYFNEATGANAAIAGSGVRAVLPAATAVPFGITALTEIAAAGLINASGVVTANAAAITARNNTVATLLSNGNVTDPLAVPAAASLTRQASNAYGAVLAMLANLVSGRDPESIAHDLGADFSDDVWDGMRGATAVSTPAATNFGVSMVAAEGRAASHVNAASAPTLAFTNYTPTSGVAAQVTATASNGGVTPITTAKNLFRSLRTSFAQLSNPSRTGFADVEMQTARNNLNTTTSPQLNNVLDKMSVMNKGIHLMESVKTTGLAGLPVCVATINFPACQISNTMNPGLVAVYSSGHINRTIFSCISNFLPPAQFVAGALPANISVSCSSGNADIPLWTSSSATYYTFNSTITPATTANTYNYVSWSVADTRYFATAPNTRITGANYAGTATQSGVMNRTIAFNGDIAANGVNYAYNHVVMNSTRTYPSGAAPAGTPAGFALAKYDATGTITGMQANGTALGSLALLAGSSSSHLEDVNGNPPTTLLARNLGQTATLIVKATALGTQLDGTLTESAVMCDVSGFYCKPTNLSFTGSITNTANTAVGQFFTGTLTDTRDFTAYDITQMPSNTNRIKDRGTFSGSVTNNTVVPAAVYRVTLNEDRTVNGQNTASLIFNDPSGNTVTANAVILNNTPTQTFNLTSGTVVGVLSRTPTTLGITSGLTGNLYVGGTPTAPGTLIGTLNGTTVNYTDGTFTTLQ
ncbi:MAG: hypothetical protein WAO71_06010 [Gallionella sp.]